MGAPSSGPSPPPPPHAISASGSSLENAGYVMAVLALQVPGLLPRSPSRGSCIARFSFSRPAVARASRRVLRDTASREVLREPRERLAPRRLRGGRLVAFARVVVERVLRRRIHDLLEG